MGNAHKDGTSSNDCTELQQEAARVQESWDGVRTGNVWVGLALS